MAINITKRQSTYWDLQCEAEITRVHFLDKEEFVFNDPVINSFSFADDHFVLMDYKYDWRNIYISAPTIKCHDIAIALSRTVEELTGGWRSSASYLNSLGAETILQTGFGLLISCPLPIADACGKILSTEEVRFTALPGKPARWPRQALIAGRNYVIAGSFRTESMPNGN